MQNFVSRCGTWFPLICIVFGQPAQASGFSHDKDPLAQMQDSNQKVLDQIDVLQDQLDHEVAERRPDQAKQTWDQIAALKDQTIQKYTDAIKTHPDDYPAHVALGEFYRGIGREGDGYDHWKFVLEKDPTNDEAMNDLANLYGHFGSVQLAFPLYEKARALRPKEPIYLYNLGATVYLFRIEATKYYHFSDVQKLFDYAMKLMERSARLASKDLQLQKDVAGTYYVITPFRGKAAYAAWNRVLRLALKSKDPNEISYAYVHLARAEVYAGCQAEALETLRLVTASKYQNDRQKVGARALKDWEKGTPCPLKPAPARK